MIRISSRRLAAALSALFCAGALSLAAPAAAENTKLRLAYLRADMMLPVLVALDAGEYKRAGVDLEAIEAQGGPAVVAALVSGAADLGYSGSIPPINARQNGIPIKIVLALGHEKAPDMLLTGFVASKASGITNLAGLKGHTMAINANGGLCELALRDHLAAAGMAWSDLRIVVLPFPQMEAALQQGVIDSACVINPFQASIMNNPDIGAVRIAAGMLADLTKPGLSDVVYSSETYLAKHANAVRAFAKVTAASRLRLLADHAALAAAAQKYDGLTPAASEAVVLPVVRESSSVDLTEVQRLLDAMKRAGMLSSPVTAEDLTSDLGN
ncbi:ABC transporter substrate-binding protein [Rhizobium sp. SG2393]|uniref:ABC transporter substrate-binding protein n=1 Tax=Rhizobium sp. SG2393 TaxID=3276279 RepID=UPI00366FBDC7